MINLLFADKSAAVIAAHDVISITKVALEITRRVGDVYAGIVEWLPIILVVKNTVTNATIISDQMQRQISFFNGYSTDPYKFELVCDDTVLHGAFITHIDYTSVPVLLAEVKLDIRYDRASFTPYEVREPSPA